MNPRDNSKSQAKNSSLMSENELEEKVIKLSKEGTSFLGCIAFIQKSQNISLSEARNVALSMSIFKNDENLNEFIGYMNSEYQNID